ncbi:MAG: AMP-binding protein [Bacteroidota bacterium]
MVIEKTSLDGSAKEIVDRLSGALQSQLVIPPRYSNKKLDISEPDEHSKQIGLFSSGSTGTPKCIWNSFSNLWKNGERSAIAFQVESHHSLLILASPWHVAGLTWAFMAEAVDCDYLFITTKKGDHTTWLRCIQDFQPDYVFTVPAVLRALYHEDWFVSNVVWGGASIQQKEYELIAPHCATTFQGYGQTEAGGLIAVHRRKSTLIPEEDEHLCCGLPMNGVEIVCSGTRIHSEPVSIKSHTAYTDKLYSTRDIGYKDGSGKLYLTGRLDALERESKLV